MTIEGSVGSGDKANIKPVGAQKTNPTADANKDANAGASTLTAMMSGSTKITAAFAEPSQGASPSVQAAGSTLKPTDTLSSSNKPQANQLYSGGNPQTGSSPADRQSVYSKD
jgi:hypothetical protein